MISAFRRRGINKNKIKILCASNTTQTVLIHCCNVNAIELAKAFGLRARLHAVAVLKRDSVSDE